MKAVLQNPKTGKLVVDEVPPPALRPEGILVRVRRSVIGLGTERSIVALSHGGPESGVQKPTSFVRRVLNTDKDESYWNRYQVVKNLRAAPIPLGYSCAGTVLEVGSKVEEFRVGDRVACYGMNFANHAEINFIPHNLAVKIPDELSNDSAAFVALGATAMQGVRLAELELGERVVVMGLGLIGQLVAQLVRASGANVLVSDPDPEKCRLAVSMGAHSSVSNAQDLEAAIARFTSGHGADAVILCASTSASELLRVAAESSRVRGRIVLVGDVGVGLDRRPIFDKEIKLVIAKSFGPGRFDPDYEIHGRDYPLPLVRWTERRNGEAFLDLLARGSVDIEPLIADHYPIERAEEAYRAVTGNGAPSAISVILDYQPPTADELMASTVRLSRRPHERAKPEFVHLGTIGAGNFAKGVLLPAFESQTGVRMRAFCTSSGPTSKAIAERYGASFCTSNPEEVVLSDEVNTVLITARHDQHAPLALAALEAGKSVFVEKPLCIRPEELVKFVKLARNGDPRLMVGHSRRFSPLAQHCRDFFREVESPLHINYRIAAPALPEESWIHDPALGGGRIISDVGHYIDMLCFLSDSLPARIHAEALTVPSSPNPNRDSVSVTIRMQNDSLGVIHFLTTGDASISREYLEVFGGGRTAILDNYRALELHHGGRRKVKKISSQQKGFREEVSAFVAAVRNGIEMPISFESIVAVSRAGFLIHESLECGEPVDYSAPEMPRPIF